MNKTLCISLLFACAAAHATTVTYGSLLDPAQVAFCTDPAHPVCVELTQISFTGLSTAPSGAMVVDENGLTTIYSFQNLNYNVDPDGTTYSGSITPDEPFSITNAENTDLQQGLFELYVVGNSAGVSDGSGLGSPDTTVLAGTQLEGAVATPEPASFALMLAGFTIACVRRRRTQ